MQPKPPYRIPSMAEIAALPWNGLNVVSTFSGCGGSCLGFKMAGYRVLWANEFVPAAQATYRANHVGTILDTQDIRKVTGAAIRAAIGDAAIDVLEGSPPCASFSTAGKTSRGWGKVRKYSDVEQRTDDLFEQYIRLIDELQPRAFVAENVAGMVHGVAKGFFKWYLARMRKLPYVVGAHVLDAAQFGVPQRRRRLIYIGVRKDVGHPRWPRPTPHVYSIRDAIPWISGVVGGNSSVGSSKGAEFSLDDPCPTVLAGGHGPHGMRDRTDQFVVEARKVEPESALGPAVGAEWERLGPGGQSEKYMSLIRPDANKPCPTVTAIGGTPAAAVAHPFERRKFSIAELRRICAFPDDFVFTGTYAQQWERMGRAVPPLMMRAVAAALSEALR